MNGKQYAERIGVPHGTIKRWLSEGLPAKRRAETGARSNQVQIDEALAFAAHRMGETEWFLPHEPLLAFIRGLGGST